MIQLEEELNSAVGALELASDHLDKGDQRKAIASLIIATTRLLGLLDDLTHLGSVQHIPQAPPEGSRST